MDARTRGPGPRLAELWAEIEDLGSASALLAWDQETHMPPAGAAGRGQVLATIAGLRHQRLCDPELRDTIEEVEEVADGDGHLLAQARAARRDVERAKAVPERLARALAVVTSRALETWRHAREADDFSLFRADLTEVVALTRERAQALSEVGSGVGETYDALLDEYEPGATARRLAPLFDGLRSELVPLQQAVSDSGVDVDESVATGEFAPGLQERFGRSVAEAIGFDFSAGRLDAAPHPFCTGLNARDVRLTWRWNEHDFRPALLGIMHEAGHGLYEQGLPERWRRTPVGSAASLGVHESQSRLWENIVGRSRSFWSWALPRMQRVFGGRPDCSVEEVWRALNVVRPSPIRVEADEVTYNLHVLARFELERALFAADLEVEDLPGAWDDRYEALLGVRPASAAEGVLQDIHWAMGAFGYFPTYTIGNLVAAQLHEAAVADLGPLDPALAAGEFDVLLGWLRERVHAEGRRRLPDELVDVATGHPLRPDAFLARVRRICEANYGVAAAPPA